MAVMKRPNGYGVRVWDKNTKQMRWIGTFPTKAEAKDAEARATLKPRRGRPVTVTEFAEMWLSDYAREAPATRSTYRYAAKQIVDAIGSMLLADLDRPEARKLATGWPRNTARVARTMFGDAMRDGLVDHNPFSDLRLETPKGRKDIDALTEPEIAELATIAERVHGTDYGPEVAAIILTLAYVGMRPGELCSARRSDLDPKTARLTIRFNTDGTGREKAPKNGKPRIVRVPPLALAAINRLPASIEPDGRIFHTKRGRPLTKGTLAYLWRPIAVAWTEAGHKPITLYHLRHACATLLLERGLAHADVAVQLGHSDGGRLVMILYGHPSDERALDRVGMAFAGDVTEQVPTGKLRRTDAGTAA